MTYGYIENLEEGTVTRIGSLPQSWKEFGNFPSHTIECINNCGWYEVEEIGATPEDYQTYTKEYKLNEDNIIRPVYTYTDMNLEDYKIKRKAYIKQAYDSELLEGCDISLGFKVDSQTQDTNNFSANYNYMVLKGLTTTNIRDYDNVVHSLTLTQYETLCIELGDYLATQYSRKWLKQVQIDDCTTLIQISQVEW